MVGLGFWQLDRAKQKSTIQQKQLQQQASAPISVGASGDLPNYEAAEAEFTKVQLNGQFDAQHIWLLENQVYQGQLGFHVIQVFLLNDGSGILVDRGWQAHSGDRSKLPAIDVAAQAQQISGQLVRASNNRLLQDQNFTKSWPRWILQIDTTAMAQQIGVQLEPWLVQINPEDPTALMAHWQHVTMPASKHIGYAIQWFAMALTLLILTVYANSNLHQWLKSRWQNR